MTIESFRHLREDYDDEVPDVIVHSGPFKVRRAWWQNLVLDLESGLQHGTVSANLAEEAKGLIDYCGSEEFKNKKLTSAGDIQRANSLLDRILGKR